MGQNKWLSMLQKDEKMILGSLVKPKTRIKTASPSLNWALGGGLYNGYSICLYGPEQSGKSLISMMAVASLHKADPEALAVLITSEYRPPTPERLVKLGVDPARLVIRQANTTHDVFDWVACPDSDFTNSDGTKGAPGMTFMLREGAPIRALIIDSIKGIRGPKEQQLESVEDGIMMDLSKVLGMCLKKIIEPIRKHNVMTILVQQVNEQLDEAKKKYEGIKWSVPNGQALKHFCEHMALVERVTSKDSKIVSDEIKNISEKSLQQGHTIRVKVDKANEDKPFREAEFKIDYDRGIVETDFEIAKLAASLGIIHHPVNPETKKPIMNQWAFESTDGTFKKRWIGFAAALEEIVQTPELQDALIRECEKV
jgi:RecA/RadA recombinase